MPEREDSNAKQQDSNVGSLQILIVAAYTFSNGVLGGLALGMAGGLALGVTSGFALALLIALDTPYFLDAAPGPPELLRINRINTLVKTAVFIAAVGLPVGIAGTPRLGVAAGLMVGVAFALGLTPWGQWVVLARIGLPITKHIPTRLLALLEDACQRNVLRQDGPRYQFRHEYLQTQLADAYRMRSRNVRDSSITTRGGSKKETA